MDEKSSDEEGDDDDGSNIKRSHHKGHRSFNVDTEASAGPVNLTSVSKKHKSKSTRTLDLVEKAHTLPENPSRERVLDGSLTTSDAKSGSYVLFSDYLVVRLKHEVQIVT